MTFPLVVELTGRLCLVVGSSHEAASRVRRLVEVGARVRWLGSGEHAAHPGVEQFEREWQDSDLDDVWLVVLADRDPERARALSAACDARRLFFCAVDQPEWNSFNHVSLIQQGPVQIAISTGGKVPALARRLRVLLEALLGDDRLARFAHALAALRQRTPVPERKRVLEEALSGLEIRGQLVVPEYPEDDG